MYKNWIKKKRIARVITGIEISAYEIVYAMKKKRSDNRMQWILLLEECQKSKNKKTYFTEYEICSEVRIPGILDYGSGDNDSKPIKIYPYGYYEK